MVFLSHNSTVGSYSSCSFSVPAPSNVDDSRGSGPAEMRGTWKVEEDEHTELVKCKVRGGVQAGGPQQ
jgi:hypothetical protein